MPLSSSSAVYRETDMNAPRPTLRQKASHEIKEYFLISLYFWIIFGVLEVHKSVILTVDLPLFDYRADHDRGRGLELEHRW
jgi:hypothetical protein